jgi:hypothetical protein
MHKFIFLFRNWIIKKLQTLKERLSLVFGELEVSALCDAIQVKALSTIYHEGKIIKQKTTPCKYRLKPGNYIIKVQYMSQVAERDVEIKENEKTAIEFKFPTGTLECRAYEGTKEVKAIVEILNDEGKLIAKRRTPFTIHLESGYYTLKAIYMPEKK